MPASPAAPAVATIVVIFAIVEGRLQVLLVHRDAEPESGAWALPGGRWDGSSLDLDEAAAAKLFEETGARDVYLEQLFTQSGLDASQPSVAIAYFALVDASVVRLRAEPDDAWRPAWHAVDELPRLAFANNRVIEQAVERVRAKLDYTNIAYGLLPERFTLRELQATYEAILGGAALDRRNFRKRMLGNAVIEPTEELRREGAHRPARLYRFTTREPVFL
jgi:8-oxo-dGTP diphosphatase